MDNQYAYGGSYPYPYSGVSSVMQISSYMTQQYLLSGSLNIKKLKRYFIVMMIDLIVRRLASYIEQVKCNRLQKLLTWLPEKNICRVSINCDTLCTNYFYSHMEKYIQVMGCN